MNSAQQHKKGLMNTYSRIFIACSFGVASFLAAGQTAPLTAAQMTPQPPEVNAKGYILIDYHTGAVLAEGNADEPLAPASLTKMMTSYIIGTEIKNGTIKPSDPVTITENAWAKQYSDFFLSTKLCEGALPVCVELHGISQQFFWQ